MSKHEKPEIGSGKCPCAIADSFNVRPIDLVNEKCPYHGHLKHQQRG
jgi:hypothetical protein